MKVTNRFRLTAVPENHKPEVVDSEIKIVRGLRPGASPRAVLLRRVDVEVPKGEPVEPFDFFALSDGTVAVRGKEKKGDLHFYFIYDPKDKGKILYLYERNPYSNLPEFRPSEIFKNPSGTPIARYYFNSTHQGGESN